MFLLTECNNQILGNIFYAVKNVLNIIQIVGPILAILSASFILVKMVMNPDDKKLPKQLFNAGSALVILFFLPIIVNTVLLMIDSSSDIGACWRNAKYNDKTPTYQEPYDSGSKKKLISNSSDYEEMTKSTPSNKSSNDSNSSTNSSFSASRVIFIGDSRTVLMYAYLSSDWDKANYSDGGVRERESDVFVAQSSKGLSWMKSTGIPASKKYFTKGSAIVILMGVNDLDNVDRYISYVNDNVANWEANGSKVYFGTVTPCDGKHSSLNSRIDKFNNKLKNNLNGVDIIDINSFLKRSGFTTTDGLHYNSSTSNKIYKYIKNNF